MLIIYYGILQKKFISEKTDSTLFHQSKNQIFQIKMLLAFLFVK
jgi:hypothetical protein